jgi:glycosyltransferase involved in cell wall biosynthesis
MERIALFIPVYNEEQTLESVLERIPKSILSHPVDLIIVDDNSSDRSAEIANRFTRHLIVSEENCGVGVSTRKGFCYIAERQDYKYVLKMDGDGQHMLHFLPQIVGKLKKSADVVICSRFHPLSDQTHTPVDRILLNMIFTEMLRKITGWNLTDVRSGYMGFHAEDIRQFAEDIIVPRYGIPMEILLRLWALKPKANVCELPHPAIYGGDISDKLKEKYSTEVLVQKGDRLQMAYASLLSVVQSLEIPRERILEMNGFAVD